MTKLKVLLLCLATSLLSVVGFNSIAHYLNNREAFTIEINTDKQTAVVGDSVECTIVMKNQPWFLAKPIFNWALLKNSQGASLKQITNTDVFFTVGQTPGVSTIIVSGSLVYNYFFWEEIVPISIWTKNIPINAVGPTPPVPPGPPIPPPPGPPSPGPVTSKLYGVAIWDETGLVSMPAPQLAIHTSTTIQASLTALNTTWLQFDKQNPAIAGANWQAKIAKLGLPCIIVCDDAGTDYYSAVMPASETDLVAAVKKLRGQ